MLMGTRCKTAATPPTTMNRTSWRVRTSISLRNRFSNSLHTFGKLMHLLECLQALERSITEASTHEASIHAVVVVLFARWSLIFEVCRHALQLTRSGQTSSTRTSRPRRLVPGAVAAAAQRVSLLRANGANCSTRRSRRTLRRARRALAPRPALRVPGARSAKGASTTGRTTTHTARSNPSNPLWRADYTRR